MRRVCLALALLLSACSSSSYDRPQDRPRDGGYGGGGYSRARNVAPMLLDVVPDDNWWREPSLQVAVNLTTDQISSLDRIFGDQRDELNRLERDLPIAQRDLRAALDADPANGGDINAAAQRVRDIRSSIFDRQTQMVSAERLLLSKQQWTSLVDALQRERQQRRDNEGYPGGYGRGRRGGYPRGGAGRPWPY